MQVQQGVHQDSQIIFTKLFSSGWPFISPLGAGVLVVPAEDPVDVFLVVPGAVQCADLVTATSCGDTDPLAAFGQSLSPTKRSVPNAQGCILPRELGLKGGL